MMHCYEFNWLPHRLTPVPRSRQLLIEATDTAVEDASKLLGHEYPVPLHSLGLFDAGSGEQNLVLLLVHAY